jgi:transposase
MNGSLSCSLLAKKYNIPDKSQIRRWVRTYKEFGADGLDRKCSKTVYSPTINNIPPSLIFTNEGEA